MMKKYIYGFLCCLIGSSLIAQNEQPILKTNTEKLSIKDGLIMRTDYWTLVPEETLDVYTADKTSKTKVVTFYSDIDSIAFEVKPREAYNFAIVLNGKDTCWTQVRSGITFEAAADHKITSDTLPFVLTKANNIYVEGVLNGVDTLKLMFHSAMNSVTLTERATQRLKKMTFDKSVDTKTWGGAGSARYDKGNSLKIGEFEWDDLVIWEDTHSGPETDGKFGPNLFWNQVIELNFDEKIMVIHSTLPKQATDYEKLNLEFRRTAMFLETISEVEGKEYPNKMLIHSGFGGTLLYDDVFANEHQLGEQLPIISESSLLDSHGNTLKTKKAVLPLLSIGDTKFPEIPVGFFEGALGRQSLSVLGGNILKRFNIFFDMQNAHIYLQQNDLMNLPYSDS